MSSGKQLHFTKDYWLGKQVTREMRKRAAFGLFKAAEHVRRTANIHAPKDIRRGVDGGTLLRSGDTEVNRRWLFAEVSYNTPYAARLHEHPEYIFQGRPRRGGKWLENACNSEADKVLRIIGDEINFDD